MKSTIIRKTKPLNTNFSNDVITSKKSDSFKLILNFIGEKTKCLLKIIFRNRISKDKKKIDKKSDDKIKSTNSINDSNRFNNNIRDNELSKNEEEDVNSSIKINTKRGYKLFYIIFFNCLIKKVLED